MEGLGQTQFKRNTTNLEIYMNYTSRKSQESCIWSFYPTAKDYILGRKIKFYLKIRLELKRT